MSHLAYQLNDRNTIRRPPELDPERQSSSHRSPISIGYAEQL